MLAPASVKLVVLSSLVTIRHYFHSQSNLGLCTTVKFVRKCVTHDSIVIRSVASYGIQYGRNMSCLGQNVLFGMRQYNCSLSDIVSSTGSVSVDNIVHGQYVQSLAWSKNHWPNV